MEEITVSQLARDMRYEGFLLVRGTAAADRQSLWLRPGDEVIITARNLFDGKVVR